jgi:hypothetical protein
MKKLSRKQTKVLAAPAQLPGGRVARTPNGVPPPNWSAGQGSASCLKFSKFVATTAKPIGTTFIRFLQRTPDGEVYLDLSFIAFRLAFTSFFTNVIGAGFPTGKLTMAFVVA